MAALLTGKRQLDLRNALYAAIVDENRFKDVLLAIDRDLAIYAPRNDLYPHKILMTVQAADRERWLLRLVDEALTQVPADPALAEFKHLLEAQAPPPHIDAFDVCLLSGGHILVNRSALRDALKDIHQAHGRRILVVRDDPALARDADRFRTGKSHSLHLISYLEQIKGDFECVSVDLCDVSRAIGEGRLIFPNDIASNLAVLLNCRQIAGPAPSDAQWSRWTLDFCNDFETAMRGRSPVWIVMDSFNKVLLARESTDFLKEIAKRINSRLFNVRLILLDYVDTLPADVAPTVHEEVVTLISEKELIQFFANAYTQMQRPIVEDNIVDCVDDVLRDMDRSRSNFVSTVTERILKKVRGL